jgi:hypothetical protein
MIIYPNLESFLIKNILRPGSFLWVLAAVWAAHFSIAPAQNAPKNGILAGGADLRAVKKTSKISIGRVL